MTPFAKLARLYTRTIDIEGSTRAVALMRIALLSLAWARWANDLLFFRHLEDGLWPLSAWFFVATTLGLVGYQTRFSMPAAAGSILALVYYVGHERGVEGYTHHHTTLLAWACVWLSFTPCGRSYSLDRWLAVRRSERTGEAPPEERGKLWATRLLALQVFAVYFWGAVDKCTLAFLSGTRMTHYLMYFYGDSTSLDDAPLVRAALMASAILTVLLEFALAFGLFFARTRRWLVIPGLLLHAVFYTFLSVFTFSATMWTLYLAFFDADAVHAVLDRLQGHRPAERLVNGAQPRARATVDASSRDAPGSSLPET